MNPIKLVKELSRVSEIAYLASPKNIKNNINYLTEKGTRPKIKEDEYIADLHAHPYISDTKSLFETLDVLVDNKVDTLALTTHGKGDWREKDFWDVKKLIKENNLADRLELKEKDSSFSVKYRNKNLKLLAAYEMYINVPGVDGRVDAVSLIPEKGFEKEVKEGMEVYDFIKLNQDYNSIIIAAHPYTIWDPHGPFGFFRFKLADKKERESIQNNLFPFVHTADRVATNCFWMSESDKLLLEDYDKTLTNSDTHSKSYIQRYNIGRAGNIFKKGRGIREDIINENFENYTSYIRPLNFLSSIAFDNPPKNFP